MQHPRISVIGLGKLGTPLLTVLAGVTEVVGVDPIVTAEGALQLAMKEPFCGMFFKEHKDRITFGTLEEAIKKTSMSFIVVPTPSLPNGEFDNSIIKEVLTEARGYVREKLAHHTFVIVSTVSPGSMEIFDECLSEALSSEQYSLVYNPTFIALGDVVRNLIVPDYLLLGYKTFSREQVHPVMQFWRNLFNHYGELRPFGDLYNYHSPIAEMTWQSAELAKILQNAFITLKITFANEVGAYTEKEKFSGASTDDILYALGMDSRIGPKYLMAGIPFGGPCFPRDNRAVVAAEDFELSTTVNLLREIQLDEQLHKVLKYANEINAECIGILGLAYKPRTPYTDESFGIWLRDELENRGYTVLTYDPMVESTSTQEDLLNEAQLIVLALPDPTLLTGNYKGKLLYDPWRVVSRTYGFDSTNVRVFGRS